MLITLGISLVTWLMVFPTTMALAPLLSSVQGFNLSQLACFSSLCATLMVARSPASAIAVLQETGGKGAFCSLVMAVVVAKDVLVIVAFAINIEMARPFFSRSVVDWHKMVEPLWSVLFSFMLGVGGSVFVTTVLQSLQAFKARSWMPQARMVALLLVATLIFQTAMFIEVEPLLACAVSGLIATNRTYVPFSHAKTLHMASFGMRNHQCFCFENQIKHILDTLIRNTHTCIDNEDSFWG